MSKRSTAGVYIDGANIFHGGQKTGWQLDYQKFITFVRKAYDPVIFSYYSCIGFEKTAHGKIEKDNQGNLILNQAQMKFGKKLEGIGYRVVTKPLKYIRGNMNKPKNKMDSEIVLAAYKEQHQWETLILLTGDSDFLPLVEEIVDLQKNVHVFSYGNNTAYEFKKLAITSPYVTYTKLDDLESILSRSN